MHNSEIVIPAWSHPLRIPADVGIAHAQPCIAVAGETSIWRLPFVLSKDVPAGAALKLQVSAKRNNRGHFRCKSPVAHLADGRALAVVPDVKEGTYVLSVPERGLKTGDAVTVVLADATAPKARQLDKFFVFYALPVADAEHRQPECAEESIWREGNADRIVAACTLHVLGGPVDRLRAIVPAQAEPGGQASLLVRPEDSFGNLAGVRPGALDVFLGGHSVPVRMEPAEGSPCVRMRVPVAEAGTYRWRVAERGTGREALTNPLRCGGGTKRYWGMIHGHTEMSDGTGTLEQYFDQLQHEVALDFVATADHDHRWETSDAFWQRTCEVVRRRNQPGRFVTFLGYEWAKWRKNGDGDRNVYYCEDDRPMYRSEDGEQATPTALFEALARQREKAIVIPHHTGHGGNFCDWKEHDEAFERLVEIYQIRGSYECTEADGNPLPERASNRHAPFVRGMVRDALALGWRVGFTAGGDDHTGQWGTESLIEEVYYKQGLMSVEARDCTRAALFEALYERRVVATTGARVLLGYQVNSRPMGSELSCGTDPELADCRRLAISCHGTGPLACINVIRNNAVVHSIPGNGSLDLSVVWEDREPLATLWLPPAAFCAHPFAFYYVRVLQEDGEVAWASPVWIDP